MPRHTEGGWATDQITVDYLRWLSAEVAQREPYEVILAISGSHDMECPIQEPLQVNMELLFVPAAAR
jgi:hypothetical protein